MAERNKQITEIAQKRERQPAKRRQREPAPPSYAAEIPQPAGGEERKQYQSRPYDSGAAQEPGATRRHRCHGERRRNRAPSTKPRRRRKPHRAPLHVLPAEEQDPFRRSTDQCRRPPCTFQLPGAKVRTSSTIRSHNRANIIRRCRPRQCVNCHGWLRQARTSFRSVNVGVFEELKTAVGNYAAGLEPHHVGCEPPKFRRGVADINHGDAGIVAQPHQVRKDFAFVSCIERSQGSSRSRSRGRISNARPIATRWRSPPDNQSRPRSSKPPIPSKATTR